MLPFPLMFEQVFDDGLRGFIGLPSSQLQRPQGRSGHEGATSLSLALEIVRPALGKDIGGELKLPSEIPLIDFEATFPRREEGHHGKPAVMAGEAVGALTDRDEGTPLQQRQGLRDRGTQLRFPGTTGDAGGVQRDKEEEVDPIRKIGKGWPESGGFCLHGATAMRA